MLFFLYVWFLFQFGLVAFYFLLQVNPFKDRICEVFSSTDDGNMTFEDFLDMMSVFSDNAPRSVKVEFAFRIYGEC